MRIFIISLFVLVSLTACKESGAEDKTEKHPCLQQKWDNPDDYMNCKFPLPPVGRWHAVYTKEFAKAHNLPLENVSKDFSPGVDYMEMEVIAHNNGATACMVNMLVKKPHDIALHAQTRMGTPLMGSDRNLLRLIDIDHKRNQLKSMITFDAASRDFNNIDKGYISSTFGMYIENALPDYDYFSANAKCRSISGHPKHFPDQYAFWIAKASVWGLHKNKYSYVGAPGRPKGRDFYKSHFFINIPSELPETIFKDVTIHGVK